MTRKKSTRASRILKPKAPVRKKIFLQRKCACGQRTQNTGECDSCASKKLENTLQAKFQIGPPDDRFEQEADRVASQVMQMGETRRVAEGEIDEGDTQESKAPVRRNISKTTAKPAYGASEIHDVTGTRGQSLDPATREFMESRFGHDFSTVRVHTGTKAERSARAAKARAFTVGRNIVFRSGQYNPETTGGRELLAHELTHTIQQGSRSSRLQRVVQVEPNSVAADDILGQFNELCSNGNFTVDSDNRIQSNCARSSSLGCECLCDVTTDPSRFYRIHVFNVINIPKVNGAAIRRHYRKRSLAFAGAVHACWGSPFREHAVKQSVAANVRCI